MLSLRLKELEAEGLVLRTVLPTTPVQVLYTLSDRGRELMTALQPLVDWGRRSVR
jgi:DNA-binding HxlR family transcriptional regulator